MNGERALGFIDTNVLVGWLENRQYVLGSTEAVARAIRRVKELRREILGGSGVRV